MGHNDPDDPFPWDPCDVSVSPGPERLRSQGDPQKTPVLLRSGSERPALPFRPGRPTLAPPLCGPNGGRIKAGGRFRVARFDLPGGYPDFGLARKHAPIIKILIE